MVVAGEELKNLTNGSKGAIWKDCDTSPWPSDLSTWASRISISGTPRPLDTFGPGWSEPGQEHALSFWPGRLLNCPPSHPFVKELAGLPLLSIWFGNVPTSQESYEYGHVPSVVAPYPGRPKFPIVQTPGHRPATSPAPGSETRASIYPVVKQNLFQEVSIPEA